ncbi:hypothetical protein [Gloeocapsopsis sp. IPPAS B-1203]|nr:hypothetical protein [Gloeocapsopsis sp. IPPAS B-1203]
MSRPHRVLGQAAFADEVPTGGSSVPLDKIYLNDTGILLKVLGQIYGTSL